MTDRRGLPLAQWTSLLSARESAEAATYRHPARRARTIASRVITKYLVTNPQTTEFRRLHAGAIRAAGKPEWTSVELLSGTAKSRVTATICQSGAALPGVWASASHCGFYSAACISRARVGLDLECIEPRRPEFCKGSFSAEERDWAASAGDREAVFTLLWSVKEAYLKASGRTDLSVWTFPRWTVRFHGAVERILQPEVDEEFVRVPAAIHGSGFSHAIEISAMRAGDMILATVHMGSGE